MTTDETPPVAYAEDSELTFDNIPNRLTLLRMAFVPLVVGLMFMRDSSWDFIAASCFTVAGITDYFDGYIARTRKLVTVYGKLMDPLADKFLVVSSLVMLQYLGRIHPTVVIVLVCRELAITGLRALASAEGVIIAASKGGKWKAAAQMVAIPFIMLAPEGPLYVFGMSLLYLSIAMSLWSAKDYIVEFFRGVRENRRLRAHERRNARQARLAQRRARMAGKAERKS